MAKKTKKTETVETPKVVEQPKVETPVMEKPLPKKKQDTWEIKDRMYVLRNGKQPLSKAINTTGIYWFDKEKGHERELKYCENQQTCFVDEMKGDQRMSHIIFRRGVLHVPREKQTLQKQRDKCYNLIGNEINRAMKQLYDIDNAIMNVGALRDPRIPAPIRSIFGDLQELLKIRGAKHAFE